MPSLQRKQSIILFPSLHPNYWSSSSSAHNVRMLRSHNLPFNLYYPRCECLPPVFASARGDVGTRLCEARGMSLAALVHGRGNPVYILQSPDVRGASQSRRRRSLDCFAPNVFLCAMRLALAKTGYSYKKVYSFIVLC